MNPEDLQAQEPMSADDAKASLGIATMLQEQMMKSQAPQMQEQPEEPQEETQPENLRDQYDEPNDELGAIREEIAGLREEIQQVLAEETNESENEEPENTTTA